jgi:hypothetical protein
MNIKHYKSDCCSAGIKKKEGKYYCKNCGKECKPVFNKSWVLESMVEDTLKNDML